MRQKEKKRNILCSAYARQKSTEGREEKNALKYYHCSTTFIIFHPIVGRMVEIFFVDL